VGAFAELRAPGKNAWAPLVLQMRQAEPSEAGGVMVYALSSADETIAFYLKEHGDRRFRTKRVRTTAEIDGPRFWVAARSAQPRRELAARGYVVGPGFVDGFGGTLFPVWRP
jgi:hypothetical protein